jgi:hypothetical protein
MTMWHGSSLVERQYTETLQIANLAAERRLIHGSGRDFRPGPSRARNEARSGFLALQHEFAAQQPLLHGVCRLARKEFVRASKKY